MPVKSPIRFQPSGQLFLVDSTGKQIGPFAWNPFQPGFSIPLGRPEYPTVLLKINGEWVAVFADYDGFGNQDGFLFYTTNHCTGTAYFAVFFEGRPVVSPSITSGGILHYVNVSTLQPMAFNSWNSVSGGIGCTAPANLSGLGSPDQTLDLSTLGFVPPFTLSVSGAISH
jgi:hypothetical protein